MREISFRYRRTGIRAERVRGAAEAARIAQRLIGASVQEEVLVLCLDTGGHVQAVERVAKGTVGECRVTLRDVFRAAVATNAARIIVAHNHPTGETAPSQPDIDLTRRMREAADLLGITLCDHLIVTDGAWLSLRDAQLANW